MEKVLTLLEDLKSQVEEEGAAEAETYKKLACFCEENQVSKSDEIAKNEENINVMESDLVQLKASAEALAASVEELTEKIGAAETELKKMTEIREEEHAIFEAEFADAEGAAEALVKAIGHLEDSKTAMLLSTKAEVQQTMLLADALGMTVKNKKAVTAFIDAGKSAGKTAGKKQPYETDLQKKMNKPGYKYEAKEEYEFKSGGIIDTLKDLQAKFEARKDELDSQEQAAQDSFNAAVDAKREQIETDKTSLETDEETLSTTESEIASTTEELTEEKAQLNDNNLYLKDITGQCETKAKEWDQRSKGRAGELAAISKALEILGGSVADKYEATGAGGRTEAAPAEEAPPMEEGPPMEEAGPLGPKGEANFEYVQRHRHQKRARRSMLQAGKAALQESKAAADSEEYFDVVFLQVGGQKNSASALRIRAIDVLRKAALTQKSLALSTLVNQLEADPFKKVKILIQNLIERLLTEATNEATHKGWCDTEMGKAEKDREFRQADAEKLNAAGTEFEADLERLKEEISTLTEELAELNEAMLEATQNRQEDKANNKKTMADANEGLTALKEAIKVLTDYYKGGAKSANRYSGGGYEGALVQASPVGEDMSAAGVEGGELGAYAGNQEAGAGILEMLETIKADFMRSLETVEANEYAASRSFAAFSQETKASISTKETGKAQAEADLDRASANLIDALNDLKDTQGLLDKSLKALEALRPACVDTGMSYEERVKRREAEIDALKQALEVLSEGDAFLQKK